MKPATLSSAHPLMKGTIHREQTKWGYNISKDQNLATFLCLVKETHDVINSSYQEKNHPPSWKCLRTTEVIGTENLNWAMTKIRKKASHLTFSHHMDYSSLLPLHRRMHWISERWADSLLEKDEQKLFPFWVRIWPWANLATLFLWKPDKDQNVSCY